MMTLLQKSGANLHSTADLQIVRQIKEQHAFVELEGSKFFPELPPYTKM